MIKFKTEKKINKSYKHAFKHIQKYNLSIVSVGDSGIGMA